TSLIADVDEDKLRRRLATRYLDEIAENLDQAIDRGRALAGERRALSVGVTANAVDLLERLLARGLTPDALTDQTSAHDVLSYVPADLTLAAARALRDADPATYRARSLDTMVRHVRAMVALQARGAITFDYGNNLRQRAREHGFAEAFAFPGFV